MSAREYEEQLEAMYEYKDEEYEYLRQLEIEEMDCDELAREEEEFALMMEQMKREEEELLLLQEEEEEEDYIEDEYD